MAATQAVANNTISGFDTDPEMIKLVEQWIDDDVPEEEQIAYLKEWAASLQIAKWDADGVSEEEREAIRRENEELNEQLLQHLADVQ